MKKNPTYEELAKLYEDLKRDYNVLKTQIPDVKKRNTEKLLNNDFLIETLFNGISDPIYMVNKDFEIVGWVR